MYYAVIADESHQLVKKLKAMCLSDAKTEIVELCTEECRIRILHVIGECEFDFKKWKKSDKVDKTANGDCDILSWYQEIGGEG